MKYLYEGKFGFFPKKKITFDGKTIEINKNAFEIDSITCVYLRPFNMAKNEWGTAYFSLDGEDYNKNDVFAKNMFKFTKSQTDSVLSFLDIMNVPVIKKGNNLEANPIKKDSKSAVIISCPNCNSIDVDFMQNNKKSFSVGKAVVGAALTSGIGTLAGFAGKKGNNQWHCKNCGTVFETKSK